MAIKQRGLICCLTLLFCLAIFIEFSSAQSDKVLLNGRVKSFDISNSEVIVTDYEGNDVKLVIEDINILAKLRDGRIKIGDDVNVKYTVKEGKKVPFSFRKLTGC